jgi:hypothetical protein
MAKIIDNGMANKDHPMFKEGIRIVSVRKQVHKEKESCDLTRAKISSNSEQSDLCKLKDQPIK